MSNGLKKNKKNKSISQNKMILMLIMFTQSKKKKMVINILTSLEKSYNSFIRDPSLKKFEIK